MAEFPALPLFTDAYMADTRHLTTLQHGAYLLLLMTAWRMPDCSLPNDDVFLSRVCGLDKRTWNNNKSVIMAFWKQDDKQNWCQGRLRDERNYVEQLRNKNAAAGKASALKKKERHSTTVITKPQPNFNPHTHTLPTPKERKKQYNTNLVSMPYSELPPEWKEWAINEKGFDDLALQDIFSLFREYWVYGKGKNTKREDWLATWRNWIRNQKSQVKTNLHVNSAEDIRKKAMEESYERVRLKREMEGRI